MWTSSSKSGGEIARRAAAHPAAGHKSPSNGSENIYNRLEGLSEFAPRKCTAGLLPVDLRLCGNEVVGPVSCRESDAP